MLMDVWIQLYFGREASDIVTSVTVPHDSDVDDLKIAVKQKLQPRLDYCAASDLEIYLHGMTFDDDSGEPNQDSLDPRASVPQIESDEDALIVVAPPMQQQQQNEMLMGVWIQLYIGSESKNVTSVTVPHHDSSVNDLKKAVKQECQRKLYYCDADDLDIYPHGTAFDDDTGEPNRDSLPPETPVPPTEHDDDALIAVAPPKQQKLQQQQFQELLSELQEELLQLEQKGSAVSFTALHNDMIESLKSQLKQMQLILRQHGLSAVSKFTALCGRMESLKNGYASLNEAIINSNN
eukprot:scaffold9174_cov80-Cylindrotheca_fusiformis.AAC.1